MSIKQNIGIGIIIVCILALCVGKILQDESAKTTDTIATEEEQIVKVGYLPLADHLPLMVGAEEGMFEGVQIEPVKFTDWPSLVEALKAGKIDGAHIINTLAVKMIAGGFDGQAVALSHRGTIGLSTHSHVLDVRELEGTTIAVPTRFSPHYMMLHNFLTNNGLVVDEDVNILDVAPPDFVSTMASGKVSAFIGSEPFPTIAETKEVGETFKLWDEMQIEGTNGLDCVIVFSSDFIENNTDIVQSYVTSIVKAGIYIEEHPLEASRAASPLMLHIDPQVLVKSIDEPKGRSTYDNLIPVYDEFDAFQDYMITIGLIDAPIDLDKFVNGHFAENAYAAL